MTLPKAPAGLSRRSSRLWRCVVEEFELSPAELELLRNALLALDRADQAADVLAAEGVTVLDRYGTPKTHPAVDVEARSRAIFGRFVAQLGVKATVESVRNRYGAKPGPRPKVAPLRQVGD
jgi:P27 family predicted phage terminase small subunit